MNKLTIEEKRIKLAEACGWKRCTPDAVPDRVWPCKSYITGVDGPMMFPPEGLEEMTGKVATAPPDYFNDLNAIHSALAVLTLEQCDRFNRVLLEVKPHPREAAHPARRWTWGSTCADMFEALGQTLKLWEAGD